jgi:lipopolysaccharide transport system permease protein
MPDDTLYTIRPKRGAFDLGLGEVWLYRELLYFLVWKELKVRYKQTVIGAGWAIIQPLVTMIIFTLLFGVVAKIDTAPIPYAIFAYSGLILWTYFSGSVTMAANSLIVNQNLVSKVYFPRILIPLSAAIVGLVDYAIASAVLVVLMVYFQVVPTLALVLFLVPLLLAFVLAAGLAFWLSAVDVKYRDVTYIVPFFIQILLFASPVIYPASFVGTKYAWILSLNPLTGIMEAQRAIIFGLTGIDWYLLGISALICFVVLITGWMYFRRYEREIADVI